MRNPFLYAFGYAIRDTGDELVGRGRRDWVISLGAAFQTAGAYWMGRAR